MSKKPRHPNSLKNLKLWEKGKSGNPLGSGSEGNRKTRTLKKILQTMMDYEIPKERIQHLTKYSDILKESEVTVKDALVAADIIDAIYNGKNDSRKRLYEYMIGKPKETVDLTVDSRPFIIKVPEGEILMGKEMFNKNEDDEEE